MVVLDTSALIRFFTKDDLKKAEKVKYLLEHEPDIHIPDVVFPELEYVLLSKTYNSDRSLILKAFELLSSRKNIQISNSVRKAISLYKSTSLDMADCIICASSIDSKLASFDLDMLKIKEVTRHWL